MNSYSPNMARVDLDHWNSLCKTVDLHFMTTRMYNRMIWEYHKSVRIYHNLGHIAYCLEVFDTLQSLCKDPNIVELAIWYHDIIYDSKATDNEERSALRALKDLTFRGANDTLLKKVRRLILLTKYDIIPNDTDGQVITDVDLSILASPPEVFDKYEHAIRIEYLWLSDREFWSGRGDFLKSMLSRKHIFLTKRYAEKFEHTARENIIRSISRCNTFDK